MIWVVVDYQTEYNLSAISTDILSPTLQRAEFVVEGHITAAAFADASLVSPVDEQAAFLVKYAIGDLALLYLRQYNITSPVADSYEESYNGVVSYKISSQAGSTALQMTETEILSRLSDLTGEDAFESTETWGSGRFTPILTIEEEDDE